MVLNADGRLTETLTSVMKFCFIPLTIENGAIACRPRRPTFVASSQFAATVQIRVTTGSGCRAQLDHCRSAVASPYIGLQAYYSQLQCVGPEPKNTCLEARTCLENENPCLKKIRIRASIFTSIFMLFQAYINTPFKLIVSDALRIAIKHYCIFRTLILKRGPDY